MKRKLIVIMFILLLLTINGCTVVSDRIYVVCKVDGDDKYCYNSSGEFFKVLDDKLLKISSVGLHDKPALQVIPSEGKYIFDQIMTGSYIGTLTSVNHYVYELLQNEESSVLRVAYADCNTLDVYVESTEVSTRIVFNIKGDVRIYAVDSKGNPIEPEFDK